MIRAVVDSRHLESPRQGSDEQPVGKLVKPCWVSYFTYGRVTAPQLPRSDHMRVKAETGSRSVAAPRVSYAANVPSDAT